VETRLKTVCNRDCPDACGIVATVRDGRVVSLRGDPDHPVTQGFLCYRTSRFLERQHAPDRLRTPLLRRGEGFRPIAWDDALDLVAEKMLRIKSESGGAAILHYRSGGSLGILKALTDHLFGMFGPVTVTSGSVCSGAGEAAQLEDFGVSDSHDLFDLRHSRTILLWGKNVHVSNVHLLPLLKEARARGARIVLVDPVRHRGADLADLVLQPRPGGDAAIGLGVSRRLFETERVDPAAADYCDHLDAFRALAFSRPLEEWARTADLPAGDLVALADAYADGPSAILVGWGMQRRTNGAAIVRVLDALGAISGNLGVPGGGVSFYFRRRGAFDLASLEGKRGAPRAIPEPLLGPGILEASDPAIRMVWITAGNPVVMLPDSDAVHRALSTRELTVVVDSFLTDTARAAHLVLPTTTLLEDDDLLGAYGHHWLGESRPVVAPPDGVATDYRILQELARRVGLDEAFQDDAETWKRRFLRPVEGRGASLEELRRGAVRNPLAPEVLFADRVFPTPTGRVRLVRELGPDPSSPPPDRPLFLMPLSTEKAQCSQWPERLQNGPVPVTVHPDAAPGIPDGALARLEGEMGSLDVVVRHDPRQRRDVALMAKGGWRHRGRCPNVLIPARLTDAGQGAVYYETAVRLVPVGWDGSALA
jgi:anaerobic selenocysteine-containing dehydrogenase